MVFQFSNYLLDVLEKVLEGHDTFKIDGSVTPIDHVGDVDDVYANGESFVKPNLLSLISWSVPIGILLIMLSLRPHLTPSCI